MYECVGGGGLTKSTVEPDAEGYADMSRLNRHTDIDTTTLHDRVSGAFE